MRTPSTADHVASPWHWEAFVSDDRRTFGLRRVGSKRGHRFVIAGSVCVAIVGILLAVTGLAVLVGGRGSGDVVEGVFWLPGGLYLVWLAVHMPAHRSVVYLTETQLRSRDALGFTWRVPRSQIVSIDLGSNLLPRASVASRIPYARKSDGTRFWLSRLAGDAVNRPAAAAQLDVVHALRAALNVGGSDDDARSDDGAGVPGSSRRDSWRHRPRASATITAAAVLLYQVALWTWLVAAFVVQGVHVDNLSHARGATVVTLRVDHTVAHCSRGCSYTSIGSYRAPWSGQTVTSAHVVPSYDTRQVGPLQVVVSPGHPREALQAGYTGKGYIAAAIAIGALASLLPITLISLIVLRLRRRTGVRRALAHLAAGAPPTGRFRGILRGPGINALIGVSRLEITPTEIIEIEKIIGGDHRWTVPLADVTHIDYDVSATIDAAPSQTWQTTRFDTPQGTFTLTCDPAYVPLVHAALDRHTAHH